MSEINWGLLDTNAVYNGAANANAMLSGLARIKAGGQLNEGSPDAAEATMNSVGDLTGANALQDRMSALSAAQHQRSATMVKDVATALDNVRTQHGEDAVLPAFDHLTPTFLQNGATPDEIKQYRQALQADPEGFLAAMSAHADDHLKQFTLDADQTRYDADGNVIAKGPDKPPGVHAMKDGSLVDDTGKVLYKGTGAADGSPQAIADHGKMVDMLADQFVTTGQMPNLGMGSAGLRQEVLTRASVKLGQLGFSGADIARFAATYKSRTGALVKLQQQRGLIGAYEGTVNQALDLVNQYAPAAMADTGYRTLNLGSNWWKKETGDPDMANLQAAINSVVNEYAKVISNATGGGVTSDAARTRAEEILNSADSVAALKAKIAVLRKEMDFRTSSLDGEIKATNDSLGEIIPGLRKKNADAAAASGTAPAAAPVTTAPAVAPATPSSTQAMPVKPPANADDAKWHKLYTDNNGDMDKVISALPDAKSRSAFADWFEKNHVNTPATAPKPHYIIGKVYKDAKGNMATWDGNKFVEHQ